MAQPEMIPDSLEEAPALESGGAAQPALPGGLPVSPESQASPTTKRNSEAPRVGKPGANRLLLGALVVVVIALGMGLLSTTRQVARLELEAAVLLAEVAEAQQAAAAFQALLGDVRVEIGDLVSRMGALYQLVGGGLGLEQPDSELGLELPPLAVQPESLP